MSRERMLSEFLININRLGAGRGQGVTLLTVSGGIDSVVMADLYYKAGLTCAVAHCNFQLRGAEADGDAGFVKALAHQYGFPFHEVRFNTLEKAEEWKVSTQMAARKLRYDWFTTLAEQYGYEFIATAHHGGDQVETILLNLTRGTGLKGLRGMPARTGRIIRPLLFATREQIRQYAETNGLPWREDRSNQDDHYRRNRIRLHVVPVLKTMNPALESTISEMSHKLDGALQLQKKVMEAWKSEVCTRQGDEIRISIDGIKRALSPEYQLFCLLEDYGFSYTQVKDIIQALDGISGKEFYSSDYRILKDRDHLFIVPLGNPDKTEETVTVEFFPKTEDFLMDPDPEVAHFDAELLKLPLKRRRWKQGDVIRPLGMGGKEKKISDLLIDRKIPRYHKERVMVIEDRDGEIVWVEGIRMSHEARITSDTRTIARIRASER